jgi:hypothetical protein
MVLMLIFAASGTGESYHRPRARETDGAPEHAA